ncbi:MAG: AraC family transcriptional regulator [Cyanobacteria bacterium P01_F01_bin.143]
MTIKLTVDEVEEQFQEVNEEELNFDPTDELDITRKYDIQFDQGWRREIELREGVLLQIARSQTIDHIVVEYPDLKDGSECDDIKCCFMLSGSGQDVTVSKKSKILYPYVAGKYFLRSSGFEPQFIGNYDIKPWLSVIIEIHPKILQSFAASPEGELPKNLKHLSRTSNQEIYVRSRDIQPMMATVLQQILYCSYQGLVKRMYLETKVIELMALVLDHEMENTQGETKKCPLRPEQIERIYYAREILLKNLTDPPSLKDLARQAGLNDFMLKQGFRYCFDTSVFAVLRSHRLDLAKKLLAEQDITVAEVAHQIGYSNARSFARAFKHKYSLNPKEYQKASR